MNLQETVKALEAKGVTVAISLGVHQHCAIDSNCPIAVELRRLVVDAGVTLEQLLEGYEATTAPDPVNYTLPEIDGKVVISIAGTRVELDFDTIIGEELRSGVDIYRRGLRDQQQRIKTLGSGLYDSYLTAIRRAGESTVMPQLSFDTRELLSAKCLVTTDGNRYVFLFPVEYKPEYLVSGGIRYKMDARDVTGVKKKVFLKLIVSKEGRFISASLHSGTGAKFQHYHGDETYDCWGSVTLPREWDRGLRSLVRLATMLMNSLATINLDSLLNGDPPHMPDSDELKDRSTEMGREGEIEEAPTEDTPREGWIGGGHRTGWGGGRRGGATPTETPAIERIGAGLRVEDVPAGEHRARRLARWGNEEEPAIMQTNCDLCGEEAGHHFGGGLICPRERVRR